jgi:hypothetical protein
LNEKGGPKAAHSDALNAPKMLHRSADEHDFCSCGWPFAGRPRRYCIGCGEPEPRRQLRVREIDGTVAWLPVPDALKRGGRS